ncbi:phage major capsid protein [uncultured Sphingomonas sp.]|uniref:phage major capsid protein n=1 Tax=uncultured Sphingomonas sp. TaxID=158754 RepID=UPI0025F89090|nr:phage major capsid protein [uncultured Sphingomonas sp.]
MKFAEQISAFETKRASLVAANEAIMEKAASEGTTLDAAQTEEFDGNQADIDAIDDHLKRLRIAEKTAGTKAAPIEGKTPEQGAKSRDTGRIEVKGTNLPKGTAFTRYAMALGRSKGNLMQAAEIAKTWHDTTPEVETVLKAAVAAGTTTDTAWAKPLVEYDNMVGEFAELLRPATIIGRIPGLRRVPFNIKIPRQTGGSSVGWVGEGKPKPVSALAFDQITLGMAKTAGIVVITDELARSSTPAAEQVVRDDLVSQTAQFLDSQFVDPGKAASAGVSPASITNGVTPVVASGTDADAVRADVQALMAKFITANLSLAGAVWIMTEMQALGLALMLNPLGQPEFPGLSINGNSGGTFMGLPVVLSENIPANAGSGSPVTGAGTRIILAKASEILLADDGQTMLDVSSEASLQMDSAPDATPSATTVFVSLWQMNMIGIRAERYINWAKRRAGAVQFIDSAAYGTA